MSLEMIMLTIRRRIDRRMYSKRIYILLFLVDEGVVVLDVNFSFMTGYFSASIISTVLFGIDV